VRVAGYSGTPLARKLGVLAGRTLLLDGAPAAWPKSASGIVSDLDENAVREYALGHGRVDVKVCAIDGVWSGLKHVIRKADR
jgi:hypothetical protein